MESRWVKGGVDRIASSNSTGVQKKRKEMKNSRIKKGV